MRSFVTGSRLFMVGVAIGSLGASLYLKKKYATEMDIAVRQLKKDLEHQKSEETVESRRPLSNEELSSLNREKGPIQNYTAMYKGTEEDLQDASTIDLPKVVTPRVIQEDDIYKDGYPVLNLTLCADGVVCRTDDNSVIKNSDILFGEDVLARFYGSVDEKTMFIANDNTKLVYMLDKSDKTYRSIVEEASAQEA